MGRLIDADVVEDMLRDYANNARRRNDNESPLGLNQAVLLLRNVPTAYDVEKVVADAEERRQDLGCNKCRHFKGVHGEECNEDCCDALIDDVLDIVRNGGKE